MIELDVTNVGQPAIRDWRLDAGSLFTDQDVRAATKVCILGHTVVEQLFDGTNPIDQTIRIRNIPFRVIGTLQAKGQNAMGQDQDDIIIVPASTLEKRLLGFTRSWGFIVSAASKTQIPDAQQQMTDLLRARHRLSPMDDNDFTIRTQTEIADAQSATSRIMTILLASIASVSLIVGGIGIMNIMLVSVTERTREIGLRQALGARPRDVQFQFLLEAVALSLIGGLVGVLAGVGGAYLFNTLGTMRTEVVWSSVPLAFGAAAAVGIFFGYYPATKAAQLDPIVALRRE